VIDPKITYASFLGGAAEDQGTGTVLDTSPPGNWIAPPVAIGAAVETIKPSEPPV